jgi:hypothetical protein
MKRTILLTITILTLAAPLAWGDQCDGSGCREQGQPEQSPTGTAPETQPGAKGTPRGFSMDDVVVGERPLEKDCEGSNCHEPSTPKKKRPTLEDKGCADANCSE